MGMHGMCGGGGGYSGWGQLKRGINANKRCAGGASGHHMGGMGGHMGHHCMGMGGMGCHHCCGMCGCGCHGKYVSRSTGQDQRFKRVCAPHALHAGAGHLCCPGFGHCGGGHGLSHSGGHGFGHGGFRHGGFGHGGGFPWARNVERSPMSDSVKRFFGYDYGCWIVKNQ